jgi:hypothetical protein
LTISRDELTTLADARITEAHRMAEVMMREGLIAAVPEE